MKINAQLVFCFGNLLIALVGLVATVRGFSRVFSAVLYFGKRDKFPDGIEDWVYTALLEARNTLIWIFCIFCALILFNGIWGLLVWLTNKSFFSSHPSPPSRDKNL